MKKLQKLSAIISIAVLLFSALSFITSASPVHTVELSFNEQADGNLIVSLILPEPQKLTSVDFSLILTSENSEITALSTEGTDLSGYIYDFDNIPENNEESIIFTHSTTITEKRINFSGFFLDSMSADGDFYLCDIVIQLNGSLTEDDIFEFTYTLNCEECSKSESHIYSLLNKGLSEKEIRRSYPAGDSDLNGKVDSTDARNILRTAVGLDSLPLEQSAYSDADYDGAITSFDARYALRLSVGLEKAVMHSFDFSLEDGANCETGGKYTLTCSITGKVFTMVKENGGHLCHHTDCFNPGKCEICNEEIHPASGHSFDENGICTVCGADENTLQDITMMLKDYIEEIYTFDTFADESLQANNRLEFIKYTQKATKLLKEAAMLCSDVTGLEKVEKHLNTAYNIRFQAFLEVTDENGDILSSAGNCNIILSAVKESNEHIDYTAHLYK